MNKPALVLFLGAVLSAPPAFGQAKNIILFIGDGAGISSLNAASIYGYGKPQSLFVQKMPNLALADTSSDGQPVLLTKTEYLLLEALMRNAGQVVSREEIGRALWGSRAIIEQNSIDVHVRGLRAKVDQSHQDKLIKTVRGFGFKLESRPEYL